MLEKTDNAKGDADHWREMRRLEPVFGNSQDKLVPGLLPECERPLFVLGLHLGPLQYII